MLSRIQDWDNRMLDRISKLRTKRLNKIMVGATTIGNSGLVWFVLAIALLPFQKYRTSGIAIIIAIIVSWLCGEVTIKNIVGRVRPCHKVSEEQLLIKNPPHYSFPSGHTTSSFAATTVMFFMHPILAIPMLFLAALIAFSRTYLLVHYITDVLAGVALGIITGCIVVPVIYSISVLNFY
ncbi:MAG: phosphatase PAP2 family protein [Pseudoruminococcus massiliensis]|uniref:phosphatase PAP2 family protein n=1 Tax=Pseudoruminococcus massiliensis TaxID=2086583 RepID=UPI0039943836